MISHALITLDVRLKAARVGIVTRLSAKLSVAMLIWSREKFATRYLAANLLNSLATGSISLPTLTLEGHRT